MRDPATHAVRKQARDPAMKALQEIYFYQEGSGTGSKMPGNSQIPFVKSGINFIITQELKFYYRDRTDIFLVMKLLL